MCQQYALRILHTAYAERYCKATKEGGREWCPSNRYEFAYNRPGFNTQRATLVLQIAKKPILCFGQNRNAKNTYNSWST